MARLRFVAVGLLALALADSSAQSGKTQTNRSPVEGTSSWCGVTPIAGAMPTAAAAERSCVIYALTDRGYDADLGKWIAQTIPEMIAPGSWKESGGAGVLRYYAPKNILIVTQSPAVQAKVDDFVNKLKTSLPKTSQTGFAAGMTADCNKVAPAEYRTPALMRTSGPLPEPSSYPVPAPVKPPKHLFHFLIRYEGEGIIDDNVVKFMKAQTQSEKQDNSSNEGKQTARQGYYPAAPAASGVAGVLRVPYAPCVPPMPSVAKPKQQETKKDDLTDPRLRSRF